MKGYDLKPHPFIICYLIKHPSTLSFCLLCNLNFGLLETDSRENFRYAGVFQCAKRWMRERKIIMGKGGEGRKVEEGSSQGEENIKWQTIVVAPCVYRSVLGVLLWWPRLAETGQGCVGCGCVFFWGGGGGGGGSERARTHLPPPLHVWMVLIPTRRPHTWQCVNDTLIFRKY